ncbi:putative oxygen-dependent FAD-linked oxidoreductase family protein [Lyophyllum shimeji]|uniref:Oxygen-dependent FAD-linked oxidoreductase family protein n=1 Tax=Lyophyllum shimeji TaxID=47721 RepID=A0A9P3UU99_LYOSH|nr:putative oxygen-dependent FAD-linked oxidoreductase family protein [Lyophyllum shimeji]
MLFAKLLVVLASALPTIASTFKDKIKRTGIDATFPGDPSYLSASSPFNLRFTWKPAVVTYPENPEEVSQLVQIAVQYNVQVVALSGGHSYIANGLGGQSGVLVVDLRNLGKVTVDSSEGTAVIETGNRLGDVATALANAGRALPHGTCAYVGIGGHAAYGGFGFTSRQWGLTLDTIIAINVVLANGTISRVTNETDPDLFWAFRGAGGSFGLVTSYEVKTFPAPPSATVFEYQWFLDIATAAKGISAFQSFVQTDIPLQFGAEVNFEKGQTSGTLSFTLVGGWYAPVQGLQAVLAPFLRQMPANPEVTLNTGTYLNSVRVLAGGSLDTKPPESHDTFYVKSLMTPTNSPMSDAAVLALSRYLSVEGFASQTEWFVQLELYGGRNSAINNVPRDATSFVNRDSLFTFQFYASSPGKVPPYPQYGFTFLDGAVKSVVSNSPANWEYGAYPNYVDDMLLDWRLRYYGSHYTRLQALKKKYDPRNLFRFPTGIDP